MLEIHVLFRFKKQQILSAGLLFNFLNYQLLGTTEEAVRRFFVKKVETCTLLENTTTVVSLRILRNF